MDRYVIRAPAMHPTPSDPVPVTLVPVTIVPVTIVPLTLPATYSPEALATNIPHTSLLDRIHREEQQQQQQQQQHKQQFNQLLATERTAAANAEEHAEQDAERAERDANQHAAELTVRRHADGSIMAEDVFEPNEVRTRVMYVEDCKSGVIPRSCHELCKWDMQPFLGAPFPIPVSYDSKRRQVQVLGYTCSVSCALSYSANLGLNLEALIVQMAKDYYGAKYSPALVQPAPPRDKLSMLYAKYMGEIVASGTTSNEPQQAMQQALAEFRNGTERLIYHVYPAPPFIRVTGRIDEEIMRQEKEEKHKQRLAQMQREPVPIACTARGMEEQRKYVLKRRTGEVKRKRGTIDALLGISYRDAYESGSE